MNFGSSHLEVFLEIDVPKNLRKNLEKYFWRSTSFSKTGDFRSANSLKMNTALLISQKLWWSYKLFYCILLQLGTAVLGKHLSIAASVTTSLDYHL